MKKTYVLLALFIHAVVFVSAQVKQIQANGAVLHYTDRGTGEPVIFIHGGLADYRAFEQAAESFSNNYRVINYSRRFNYPNHNIQELPDYSEELEADDLAAMIKALDLTPAHIIGHSYGGVVALAFAKKYPHLVRSLTLSEPPVMEWLKDMPDGLAHYEQFYNELWRPVQIAFELRDTADVLRHTFTYFAGKDISGQIAPTEREMIIANFPEWKAIANSSKSFKSITRADVQKLKMPVMLISAGNTFPSLKLTNAELQRLLPDATHFHLAEGTHNYWLTHPDVISREVLSFLQNCPKK